MTRKNCTSDFILFFIFLVTVFLLAFNKIHDTDAWLHLSIGRLIWELKGLPANELFVYPNFTEPFRYSSWLFAVLFYLAFLVKGAAGLVFLKALPVTAAFFFLLRDSLRPEKNGSVAVIVLSLGVLIAMPRFVMRPDIFLMLFLAATIFILNSFLYDKEKKGLYFLPLILLFWANIHASVNLIVIPVGAFVIGSVLQRYLNQRGLSEAPFLSSSQIKLLLIFFGFSFLLSLLNPNGFGQYGAGAKFIGVEFYKQQIIELLPPTGSLKIMLFVVAGLIALSFFFNPKNVSIVHLLLVMPFLVMPFTATRFIYLMVIVGGPIFVRNIAGFCTKRKSIDNFVQSRIVTMAVAIAIIFFGMLYVNNKMPLLPLLGREKQFGVGFDESTMPAGAVAFMDREGIYGRVFNTFSYGQYIIWTGYPKRQVFIDARGGLSMELLEKNFGLWRSNAIIDELFEKYKFDSIIVRPDKVANNDSTLQKIETAFKHPEWALVYWDDKSLLYLKRKGPYGHIVNKYEYKYFNADTSVHYFANNIGDDKNQNELERELLRNIDDTGSTKARLFLGILYYNSGKYNKAIDILEFALLTYKSTDQVEIYINNVIITLGDIYFATGNFQKSLDYYQKVPGNENVPGLQYYIGLILYRQGEIKKAISHFEEAIKLDKKFMEAYGSLVSAYRENGQDQKAAAIQKAYDDLMAIQTPKMYFEMGLIAQQKGDLDSAIVEYKKSLEANPSAPVVWANLGFVYLDKKDLGKAYEFFMKAIDLQTDFADAHYGLALVYKENKVGDKAIEHFEKYCELEPEGYFYRTAREQIQEIKQTR